MVRPSLDVYKVLELTEKFANYPKNRTGIVAFLQNELKVSPAYHKEFNGVAIGSSLFSLEDFGKLILKPLYHCEWDNEIKHILASNDYSSIASWFLPSSKITIESIPEDWRDLADELVRKGYIKLEDFDDLEVLEKEVDRIYFSLSPTNEDVVSDNDRPLHYEEKETLAKTLQLDINSFTTKKEALKIYEERCRCV